jgi:hypothetical protein
VYVFGGIKYKSSLPSFVWLTDGGRVRKAVSSASAIVYEEKREEGGGALEDN